MVNSRHAGDVVCALSSIAAVAMLCAVLAVQSCSTPPATASEPYSMVCQTSVIDGVVSQRCENFEAVCYVHGNRSSIGCFKKE